MKTQTHPNGTAPASGPRGTRLGVRGGKVGQGWQMIWDQLSRSTWTEGQTVSEQVAHELNIQPASMIALLHRMAAEGILERQLQQVDTYVVRTARRSRPSATVPTIGSPPRVIFRDRVAAEISRD
jgi:hypothetical protein